MPIFVRPRLGVVFFSLAARSGRRLQLQRELAAAAIMWGRSDFEDGYESYKTGEPPP